MEKQPFDETGLQQLLLALYALPDDELTEEAYALRSQPKLWINGHFELDQDQLEFLHLMPMPVANFLGQEGAFAIENRLPIHLQKTYPTANQDGDKEQDKLFKPTSNLSIQTDNLGQVTAGGELNIEVAYIESA
ncbi:MAG: hypothetical protein EOO88_15120 [Pedobacter sp.]|nr:MAG: hypothetical protein EOO88_15120 [Pedobacter sp.]